MTRRTISALSTGVDQSACGNAPDDEKRALVMLARNEVEAWLHATVEDAAEFLEPYPAEVLTTQADPRPPAKRAARYTE